jgi:thioredoxin-dependent peroxiredoxin
MREFRVHYNELKEAGVEVAGISTDTPGSSRDWARRMELPYPLLSDEERVAGAAFDVIRRVGIGAWNVEFFKRSTFLVDALGIVVAQWRKVKVRGHAAEVLEMVRVLPESSAGIRAPSAPRA